MRSLLTAALQALALAVPATAHFVLQSPSSIGYEDLKEGEAPCGGFDIMKRDPLVEWPVAGLPVALLSTHPAATYRFRAALINDTTKFVNLVPLLSQSGFGALCLTSMPGIAAWAGLDAVVQITQTATDGDLYQVLVPLPCSLALAACASKVGLSSAHADTAA